MLLLAGESGPHLRPQLLGDVLWGAERGDAALGSPSSAACKAPAQGRSCRRAKRRRSCSRATISSPDSPPAATPRTLDQKLSRPRRGAPEPGPGNTSRLFAGALTVSRRFLGLRHAGPRGVPRVRSAVSGPPRSHRSRLERSGPPPEHARPARRGPQLAPARPNPAPRMGDGEPTPAGLHEPLLRPARYRQDAVGLPARAAVRVRGLQDRPVDDRLEIHRGDRKEPEPGLRPGRAPRLDPVLRRGRLALRQAHPRRRRPRPVREPGGQLPPPAHRGVRRGRHPGFEPAGEHRRRVSAPVPLGGTVPDAPRARAVAHLARIDAGQSRARTGTRPGAHGRAARAVGRHDRQRSAVRGAAGAGARRRNHSRPGRRRRNSPGTAKGGDARSSGERQKRLSTDCADDADFKTEDEADSVLSNRLFVDLLTSGFLICPICKICG